MDDEAASATVAIETEAPSTDAPPKDALAEKILAYEKMKCKARQFFIRADEMADEIIPILKKRKRVRLSDARFARVKDNFARKNKAFKQAGIERFEIEIIAAE